MTEESLNNLRTEEKKLIVKHLKRRIKENNFYSFILKKRYSINCFLKTTNYSYYTYRDFILEVLWASFYEKNGIGSSENSIKASISMINYLKDFSSKSKRNYILNKKNCKKMIDEECCFIATSLNDAPSLKLDKETYDMVKKLSIGNADLREILKLVNINNG